MFILTAIMSPRAVVVGPGTPVAVSWMVLGAAVAFAVIAVAGAVDDVIDIIVAVCCVVIIGSFATYVLSYAFAGHW